MGQHINSCIHASCRDAISSEVKHEKIPFKEKALYPESSILHYPDKPPKFL